MRHRQTLTGALASLVVACLVIGCGSAGNGGDGGGAAGADAGKGAGAGGHAGDPAGTGGHGGVTAGTGGSDGGAAGAAGSDAGSPCGCTSPHAAVCGLDGKTYPSACEASCAGAVMAHAGPCGDGGASEEAGGGSGTLLEGATCDPSDDRCGANRCCRICGSMPAPDGGSNCSVPTCMAVQGGPCPVGA